MVATVGDKINKEFTKAMSNLPPNVKRNHIPLIDSELKSEHVLELYHKLAKKVNIHTFHDDSRLMAFYPPPKPEERVLGLIADSSDAVLRLARGKLQEDDRSIYLKSISLGPILKALPNNKALQHFQKSSNSILLVVGIAWGPMEENLRIVSLTCVDK